MLQIQENFSLQNYNTFGINASCSHFVEVKKLEDFQELIPYPFFKKVKKMVLGGGSNILFTTNYEGLVIKNSLRGIEHLNEDEDHVWLKVGAGEVWHQFVLHCIEKNFGGVENLSLIPGLVGAAPMQNIGAYGVELESVFESLEALDIQTGEQHFFQKKDCDFGYRESVFKNIYKDEFIITAVTLRLNKNPVFNISYGAIKETLEKMNVQDLTIKAVSDAVIAIRTSKLPDPKKIGNAGSFFKNPEVPLDVLHEIQKNFPAVPNYPLPYEKVKIPAGWLIEQCGWKGKKIGNTGAHKDQALVLVNYGNATGGEIFQLAMDIKKSVHEKFGIEIQPEVNII